jgi:hypothetical protein
MKIENSYAVVVAKFSKLACFKLKTISCRHFRLISLSRLEISVKLDRSRCSSCTFMMEMRMARWFL